MYVCMCVYVCVYECMYVCVYVGMHVICMRVLCMFVYMCVCICVYVRVYVRMCACTYVHIMYVCMYVYMYAYMNFCKHCLFIRTDMNSVAPALRFPVFLPTLLPPTSNPLYHPYLSFRIANLSKSLFFLALCKFHFTIQGWKSSAPARTLWVIEMLCFSLTHSARQTFFVTTGVAEWRLTN
jgi:hypothetical protein